GRKRADIVRPRTAGFGRTVEAEAWVHHREDGRTGKSLAPLSAQSDVIPNSAAEVKTDNQDSGSGDDLGDPDLAAPGQVDDVAPTGGQTAESQTCPPVGNEPRKRKPRAKKNVLSFKLPTGGQKRAKRGKQKTSPKLPTGGQDEAIEWLKGIL